MIRRDSGKYACLEALYGLLVEVSFDQSEDWSSYGILCAVRTDAHARPRTHTHTQRNEEQEIKRNREIFYVREREKEKKISEREKRYKSRRVGFLASQYPPSCGSLTQYYAKPGIQHSKTEGGLLLE
jgi:hypothetical protein